MIRLAATGKANEADREIFDETLPVDGSRSSRNVAFHGQMRCEIHVAMGESANALDALRIADASGLLDLVWLEKCPLLAPLRGTRDYQDVLAHTKERAARVIAALDG
jgi:serine/threonine-protein kinase